MVATTVLAGRGNARDKIMPKGKRTAPSAKTHPPIRCRDSSPGARASRTYR